jgi:cytochrome c peroxidase
MTWPIFRSPLLIAGAATIAIAGCSGGGDFGTPTGQATPGTNQAPVLASPVPDQNATVGTAFSFDVSNGGTAFTDADGDPLSYAIVIAPANSGLAAAGSFITGIPAVANTYSVVVTASDGRGGIASDTFEIACQAASGGGGGAIPTPTPGAPNLPAVSFDYSDAGLPPWYTTNGPGAGGNIVGADTTPLTNPTTNAGATLGRVLFHDKRLSANDSVSCASCHAQAAGFSDTRVLSVGFNGGLTGRHSMGLSNARYYNPGRFFWDERASSLEDQVVRPIQDMVEMGMTLPALEQKLSAVTWYGPLFQSAFGSPQVTSDRISRALAQFVRSMVSYRSKFDQAMATGGQGSPPDFASVFTPQELEGLQIFGGAGANGPGGGAGPGACAGCHGTVGHIAPGLRNNGLDADTSADQGAGGGLFKSPSLRNIAVRAPYMHDGRFSTLRQVIDFYDSGVQDHPNLSPPLRTPGGGVRRMNLTEQQKQALEAFLNTLTDTPLLTDPRFADPFQ